MEFEIIEWDGHGFDIGLLFVCLIIDDDVVVGMVLWLSLCL